MELIPSFKIDHTKLLPGIYESRVDFVGEYAVTTFDLRMKRPNAEPVIDVAAMHTIEHIVATFLRNDDDWKDKIVYFGPMGCLTGCYLIVKGRPSPEEMCKLVIRAFEFCRNFSGDIPGNSEENCGNYRLHNLDKAKYEAGLYLKVLNNNPCFEYPLIDK